MKNDWLSASSFERTYEVVSAINTLSIHAKLLKAGISNLEKKDQVEKSRSQILKFLAQFRSLIERTEQNPDRLIVGTDPRLGELAVQFLNERRQLPQRSVLYSESFDKLASLIASERLEDIPNLINCLRDLRLLLEEYSQQDMNSILGDG